MNFDRKYKIQSIVSQDFSRPNITNVFFDKEKKRCVATNGVAMAIIEVSDCDRDVGGQIQPEAFTEAAKKTSKHLPPALDAAKDTVTFPDGCSAPRAHEAQPYPIYERVLPTFDPKDANVVRISFDAALLAKMAKALGASQDFVTLAVDLTNLSTAPMLVMVSKGQEAFGVLMPANTADSMDKKARDALSARVLVTK
jgi:hypothetical protein